MQNNLCELCLKDASRCKRQTEPCNYMPKYNKCPICKELVIVYEPRCDKCGYDFKAENKER